MANSNFTNYIEVITELLNKRIVAKSISLLDKNIQKMRTLLDLGLLTEMDEKMAKEEEISKLIK